MTIHITLGSPEMVVSGGGEALLLDEPVANSEILSTAGVASSTITTARGQVWVIWADVDLFVEFGEAPTGTGPKRWRMGSGDILPFLASAAGRRVAFSLI